MRSGRNTFILTVLVCTLTSACIGTTAPERTGLLTQAENVTTSEQQLVIRINEFTEMFLGAVEYCADLIRAQSDDPEIRLAALIWKINATSAMLHATAHQDPVIAFLDAWALCYQTRDFFTTGKGVGIFGDQTELAAEFAEDAVTEIMRLAAASANEEGVANGKRKMEALAVKLPITNEYFLRRSVVGELIDELPLETIDAFAALGSISQTVESMQSRLAIYLEYLPKQGRWQAELLLEETRTVDLIQEVIGRISAVDDSARRLADIVDDAPVLDERFDDTLVEMVGTLQQEIADLGKVLDRQRESSFKQLGEEYVTIFDYVKEQRIAALDDIERQIAGIVVEIDRIAAQSMEDAGSISEATVDYAFGKVLLLLVLVAVGALLLMIAHRFLYRRH